MEFSYMGIIRYHGPCMVKDEMRELILKWRPSTDKKELKKLKAAELEERFFSILTEARAKRLVRARPVQYGYTQRDIEDIWKRSISTGQLQYLARRGRLKKVGTYCSPVSDFETDIYAPEEVYTLTEEDFSAPDMPDMVTQTMLSHRGWTQALIDKFLPTPELFQNPVRKRGAPMKKWHIEDVEAAMETEAFKAEQEKAKKRRAGARKAVETKREATMAKVEEKMAAIRVRGGLADQELVKRTLKAKQDWYDAVAWERGEVPSSAYGADSKTEARWVVNYIRHNLTDYDDDLFEMSGRPGCHEAYQLYREAVLDRIAKAYPKYAAECKAQKTPWGYR